MTVRRHPAHERRADACAFVALCPWTRRNARAQRRDLEEDRPGRPRAFPASSMCVTQAVILRAPPTDTVCRSIPATSWLQPCAAPPSPSPEDCPRSGSGGTHKPCHTSRHQERHVEACVRRVEACASCRCGEARHTRFPSTP